MQTSTLADRSAGSGRRRLTTLAVCVLPLVAVAAGVFLTKNIFVAALLGCGGALLLTVLSRPGSATYFFVFLSYINAPVIAVHYHGMPVALAGATVCLLILPVMQYVLAKREPLYLDPVLPWLLAFVVIQVISALLAADKPIALDAVFVYVTEGLVLFLLITNAVRTPEALRRVTWVLIAAGVFMGGLVVFQKVSGTYWRDYKGFAQVSAPDLNAYGEHVGGRWPSGPIGDKNYFAQFMVMLTPLALFRFWRETDRTARLAGLVSTIVILAGIGLTGSRGAAVGFAAMLLVMVSLRYVTVRQVATLAIVSSLLLMLMPEYRERVVSIVNVLQSVKGGDVRGTDAAVQGRLTEMAAALLVFQENPLVGVGPGNFPAYFTEKADLLGFTVHGVQRRAHCLYLEIAAEMGIPGLFCFLMILIITVKDLLVAHAVTRSREMEGLTASYLLAIIAMMATGVFLSFAYVRYSWLMIGLASCSARIALLHNASPSVEQADHNENGATETGRSGEVPA